MRPARMPWTTFVLLSALLATAACGGPGPTVERDADAADTYEPGDGYVSPCPSGDGATVGAEGGTVTFGAAVLDVPAGALADSTLICIDEGGVVPPDGYTAYSPVYTFTPSGLTFAKPATLTVTLDAAPPRGPAGFISRAAASGYDWLGATVSGNRVTTALPHFSDVFIGDGELFTDPPDTSCARTRLLEGRVVPPSGVALFLTADDCNGTPLTALPPESFAIYEDGAPLTSESAEVTSDHEGVTVFVTLVFDMSSSTAGVLTELTTAARAFVSRLGEIDGTTRLSVELFSGAQDSVVFEDFQLDPDVVLARLDALSSYVPRDPSSTNLRGALVSALNRSKVAQEAYRERQAGGAFTVGHVVLFTDGRDTAGWLTEADAVGAVERSQYEVVGVGLQQGDYDEAALARLTPGGVFSALDADGLETAFLALANRIARQAARSYAVFYCSPNRLGPHTASVRLVDATMEEEASFTFVADDFGPGCVGTQLAAACAGRACGGLGCGACDEAREACEPDTGACVDACTVSCATPGATTNPAGYVQDCSAECDADWIPADDDNCPFATNAEQLDLDGDGLGDPCDPDIDGDGVANDDDRCPDQLTGWTSIPPLDHDEDGCHDFVEDDDDDGDGVTDELDVCDWGNTGWLADAETDHDSDGCRDAGEDADDDGDGVDDVDDRCPVGEVGWTAAPAVDHDGDGCRDASEDGDDDDDGVADVDDGCDVGTIGWTSTAADDHDGDGCRDADEDTDDDGDGRADTIDACPLGQVGWTSTLASDDDRDGCRDEDEDDDDDGDGLADGVDACPRGATGWTSTAATDTDGDGCRDANEDTDDDDDGVLDVKDGCPHGPLGWVSSAAEDRDGDGCRDADLDDDDDGDGVADGADGCPLGEVGWTSTAAADHDGDGCRDAVEDDDDDGDGVLDDVDACPRGLTGWTSSPETDGDADGCRYDEDPDRDDDGVLNAADRCPAGAKGWTSEEANDHDHDGCRDEDEDDDDDNDGEPDDQDGCPRGRVGWTQYSSNDYDDDGCYDADEDLDDDDDGVPDLADGCPKGNKGWTSTPTLDYDGDGCRDATEDTDDDGDHVLDGVDACPKSTVGWISTSPTDPDHDGCEGGLDEIDSDGDGVKDTLDTCPWGRSNWTSSAATDHDGDGCKDDAIEDEDDDGDGVADTDDVCPRGELGVHAADLDDDGCADAEDDDDDGDGVVDSLDACLGLPTVLEDADGDGCPDVPLTGDVDADGLADGAPVCAGPEPCLCGASDLCVVDETAVVAAPENPYALETAAAFAADQHICTLETRNTGLEAQLTVNDLGPAGETVWSDSFDPVPEGIVGELLGSPRLVDATPSDGVACMLLAGLMTWGPGLGETTDLVYWWSTTGVRHLAQVDSSLSWAQLRGSELTYVGPTPNSGNFFYSVVRHDVGTGDEVWRAQPTVPDATSLQLSTGWVEPDGSVYVAGSAKVGTERLGVIVAYTADGVERWTRTIGEPCECGACELWITHLAMTAGQRLRATGQGFVRAVVDTAGNALELWPSCGDSACATASFGDWLDVGCEAVVTTARDRVEVRTCVGGGVVGRGSFRHGLAEPQGRHFRAVGQTLEVLAHSWPSAAWYRVRYAPCQSPPPLCDDGDACTEDALVGGVCEHAFQRGPSCGRCVSNAECVDDNGCTIGECAPFTPEGCTHYAHCH